MHLPQSDNLPDLLVLIAKPDQTLYLPPQFFSALSKHVPNAHKTPVLVVVVSLILFESGLPLPRIFRVLPGNRHNI